MLVADTKGATMSAIGMMTARERLQLLGLGLALAAVILVVLAVVLPLAAFTVAVAMLAATALVVARQLTAAARAARSFAREPFAGEATRPVRLELADGTVVSARPVPLPGDGEHTLMLTREGYVLVSAEGRVIHRI
jgi:hypothetical protein